MVGIELEKAVSVMLENIHEITDAEEVNLLEANGRVIAEGFYAPISNPPFDRSPLDGYALKAYDTKGAGRDNPIKLKVIDEVFAGEFSNKVLKNGEAIRIMTGAKMPEGADCVVRQENTNEDMEEVEIYKELSAHDNYIFKGEDIVKGDLLIKKGEVLNYVHQGIIASMGKSSVKVIRKIKAALFVTGDEVSSPGKDLSDGKIYDSNLYLIYSRLVEFGITPIFAEIIEDKYEKVAERIKKVIDEVDIVITTGGVSVGKKDILHEAIPFLGADRIFWKVKLKPGTPAMFSIYRNKPILSLSGNPFAALSTFELLGRPVLSKISGNFNINTRTVTAVMDSDFNKSSKVRRFVRGLYEDGKIKLISNKHSSGMLSSMNGCNALIDIKAGTAKLSDGDDVSVILL
ncbi:molybdopterin biosynthesis MoeA protein [Clostridium beijerinckii]|uniref:Molybdopterin molybdenumtransferase n=1 Tax=Clostridium beijerinckii TaxID=1520 RepID=A0A0B5QDC8_CLOBE|nr:gephyrin-like molybdotransferase Glp [Clostridium beijerinckii]AJH00205.1 molybdopterin biosynthesis MoeA protein [Clostridium beijerinckii]